MAKLRDLVKSAVCGLKKRRGLPGFAMIETVVALAIMTLFSTYFVSTILSVKRMNIDANTKKNADMVFHYLANYVAQTGALPYPGRPDSGYEVGHAETESDWETMPDRFMRGIVPYKTLGMDKQYARDGHGTYFTYVVNPCLCMRKDVQSVPPGDARELLEVSKKPMVVDTFVMYTLRCKKDGESLTPNQRDIKLGPYASFNAVRSYDEKYGPTDHPDARTTAWDIATSIPNAQLKCIEDGEEIKLSRYMSLIPPFRLTLAPAVMYGMMPSMKLFLEQVQGSYALHIMYAEELAQKANENKFRVYDCIAIALISHGKSRCGSFQADGSVISMKSNMSREKRANGNSSEIKNEVHLNKKPGSEGVFDDKVFWVSRFGLGTRYGSFVSKPFQIISIPFEGDFKK